jgi:hypothetical protein
MATYNASNRGCTFSLYKWQGDYASTLSSSVLANQSFTNIQDNSWVVMWIADQYYGEYLLQIHNPVNGKIGVWAYDNSQMGHYYSYKNNNEISGNLDMQVSIDAAVAYQGEIISGPQNHAYGPAHMYKNGIHRLWFMDLDSGRQHDQIYYTEKTSNLMITSGWNTPFVCFTKNDVPFSYLGEPCNHVGDISLVFGDFDVYGTQLTNVFGMSFTSGHGTGDNWNCIGTAYTSTGYSNWWVMSNPTIIEDKTHTQGYGVGMGSVAWDPVNENYVQVYYDESYYHAVNPKVMDNTGKARVSLELVNWYPLYPNLALDTKLDESGRFGFGQGFDIAYNSSDQRWYGVLKCPGGADVDFRWDAEVRILRATEQNSYVCDWETLGVIDYTVTGNAGNHNPCLARYSDGSLYTEGDFMFIFFGTGTGHDISDYVRVGQALYLLN